MLIRKINNGMEQYDLTRTARLLPPFIDNLSNWYIRRSRKRFWKSESDTDKNQAYQTLYTVLVTLSKLMAPFTPFLAEEMFKNLTEEESVHLQDYPMADGKLINTKLNEAMNQARRVVELGLAARAEHGIKVRQPLALLEYSGQKLEEELESIIAEEVNVKALRWGMSERGEVAVALDTRVTPELRAEGIARELIRNIQSLRKKAEFEVGDRIILYYQSDSADLLQAMDQMEQLVSKEVLATKVVAKFEETEASEEFVLDGETIWVGISRV
ncbi:MAG: Isoleucine--tRNA ligase [bacterium ADurb.Bin400]|nr:MAG: Isoleucine--tRNA ligase [bacterium ADurb.Bin400]